MDYLKGLLNFLFPKKQRVIVLESLGPEKLISTLPRATGPDKENVIALFDYSHPVVKELIWEVKYGGNRVLAKKIGGILYDVITDELGEKNIIEKYSSVILLPMPVSGKRRFERGWNQSELITNAIKSCDSRGIFKHYTGQLVKIRHTESQTKTASKSERQKNLTESMKVMNPRSVEGRFVIVVDDVITTGSTFAEARRALKAAGARKILCIAVAH